MTDLAGTELAGGLRGEPEGAGAARGRLEALLDRANPILVKEVRQSLRGRYFTVLFWLTLGVATLLGASYLAFQVRDQPDEDAGITFFMMMYGCLSAAVHVFVPFAAYLSLGAEREENTFDLLVLSNLRPRRILTGKLLSAGVQVLLYYSAFGPFLAFAFLLPGLDLVAAGLVLALTLVSSLGLSILALSLASLHRNRLVRSFQMALLAAFFVPLVFGTVGIAEQIITSPDLLQVKEARYMIGFLTTAVLFLAGVLFAYGCTRLAHPEENRSTGLRVLMSLGAIAGCVWLRTLHRLISDPVFLRFAGVAGLILLFLLSISFLTEEERLGRRVHLHVPRSRALAFLGCFYLPGGGRGFLYFLLHLALILAVCAGELHASGLDLGDWAAGGFAAPDQLSETALWLLTFAVYGVAYVGLPAALFARFTRKLAGRIAARAAIPLFVFLGFFVPTVTGYLFSIDALEYGEHLGNPIWIPDKLESTPLHALLVVMGCAALALLVNLPRVVRGVRESFAASAARRARTTGETGGNTGGAASAPAEVG